MDTCVLERADKGRLVVHGRVGLHKSGTPLRRAGGTFVPWAVVQRGVAAKLEHLVTAEGRSPVGAARLEEARVVVAEFQAQHVLLRQWEREREREMWWVGMKSRKATTMPCPQDEEQHQTIGVERRKWSHIRDGLTTAEEEGIRTPLVVFTVWAVPACLRELAGE